jgi:SAM-dependent methyltransferase
MWWKILYTALKRNGWRQMFFYLSNLDVSRFIEFSKTIEYLNGRRGLILELGCGYSVLPALLSDSCERYICLDLSKGACKYQESLPNVASVMADMKHLPFKTGVIPAVVAISSIEHVPDDGLVFKEISRVSKKNAEVIISIPYSNRGVKIKKIEHPKFMIDNLYKFKKFWAIILGPHLDYFIEQTSIDSFMKYYTMEEINGLLKSVGFCIKNYYLYEKWLQQKFFGIVPKGWFVLKDLVVGWVLWKLEDELLNKSRNSRGIVAIMEKLDVKRYRL